MACGRRQDGGCHQQHINVEYVNKLLQALETGSEPSRCASGSQEGRELGLGGFGESSLRQTYSRAAYARGSFAPIILIAPVPAYVRTYLHTASLFDHTPRKSAFILQDLCIKDAANMVSSLHADIDLLNPPKALELQKHKLKRLVQAPNSYFMDVKCAGCFQITTVFSHSQTVVLCSSCSTVLCTPTGGKARLTEGASFRRKGD